MESNGQEVIRKNKVILVVNTFLEGDYTIEEVSKITGISSSSVQRYLNNVDYICECFPSNAKEIISKIKDKLDKNKIEGLSRGGINYSKNNECTKDELGHFTGSKRK